MQYFAELRRYLIQILIFFFLLFIAFAPFSRKIYGLLAQPLQAQLPVDAHMIATDITSTFVAPFKLIMFLDLIMIMPFIFFRIYSFLNYAMYKKEKRVLFTFFSISILLFYFGLIVGYYFVLPQVLKFFMSISPDAVIPMTDINQYLIFCIKLFLIMGFIFQLPLITVILIYFNFVELDVLKSKRAFVFVGCFFIAMFVTPPDILSMSIAGSFMYLLFELGLIVSSFLLINKNDKEILKKE